MQFTKVLLEKLTEKNMSQAELCRITGIPSSLMSAYVANKKSPALSNALAIATAFNIALDDLVGRDFEHSIQAQPPKATKKQAVRINVYGSMPADVPIDAIKDIVDWEEIPSDMTEGGKEYVALKVKGDSMYPKYLEDDIVIILLQPDCESGDDCAVYVNGHEATLKTVKKGNNTITLKPFNPNYPPATYTHSGEVTILGKVVELRRKI